MYRYQLSEKAAKDVEGILDWTMKHHGEQAMLRYKKLLNRAIADVGENPFRPGSASRSEIGASIRVYHIRFSRARAAAGPERVNTPRHLLLYRIVLDEVQIVRVLHDRMDVERHLSDDFASNDNDPTTSG